MHPRPVLDLVDVQLHGDVEAVQNVAPEDQGVGLGVDGVDPAWGQKAAHVGSRLIAGDGRGRRGGEGLTCSLTLRRRLPVPGPGP